MVQDEDNGCHVHLEDVLRVVQVRILLKVLLVWCHHFDAKMPRRTAEDRWPKKLDRLQHKAARWAEQQAAVF